MRLVIAGSRGAQVSPVDMERILGAWLNIHHYDVTSLLCGGARGADSDGEAWAKWYDRPITYYIPDWNTHGKAAGPIRNAQMAKAADVGLVLWDGKSPGSRSMISEMAKLSKPCLVVGKWGC